MIPSSPPGSGRGTVQVVAKDKPTIIAFSRQGPRNQGVSSANRHQRSAASPKVLSNYRSANTETPDYLERTTGLATQLFPPSSQPSYGHSTKVKRSADLGNIAKDDESAFGDFTKDGKNKTLAKMLQQPSTVVSEPEQGDQDNGFAVTDDFEGTTLVDDHQQPESSPKQPTASQVASKRCDERQKEFENSKCLYKAADKNSG